MGKSRNTKYTQRFNQRVAPPSKVELKPAPNDTVEIEDSVIVEVTPVIKESTMSEPTPVVPVTPLQTRNLLDNILQMLFNQHYKTIHTQLLDLEKSLMQQIEPAKNVDLQTKLSDNSSTGFEKL